MCDRSHFRFSPQEQKQRRVTFCEQRLKSHDCPTHDLEFFVDEKQFFAMRVGQWLWVPEGITP